MLRKIEVVETGDTAFLRGEQMDRAGCSRPTRS